MNISSFQKKRDTSVECSNHAFQSITVRVRLPWPLSGVVAAPGVSFIFENQPILRVHSIDCLFRRNKTVFIIEMVHQWVSVNHSSLGTAVRVEMVPKWEQEKRKVKRPKTGRLQHGSALMTNQVRTKRLWVAAAAAAAHKSNIERFVVHTEHGCNICIILIRPAA